MSKKEIVESCLEFIEHNHKKAQRKLELIGTSLDCLEIEDYFFDSNINLMLDDISTLKVCIENIKRLKEQYDNIKKRG